jgi:3-hydroxyisobutyrate dehydrogenase-like beta-hydroxyacid dehydrogenase
MSDATSKDAAIGFIGLGGMGAGLVKNLLKHGRRVTAMDRRDEAAKIAAGQGATIARSLTDIAACPIVLLCVSTAEDVEALAMGAGGLLENMRPGQVLIEHTTTNPELISRLAAATAAKGIDFAEAPMTRTPLHADQGKVNVLYGGSAEVLERLRPVFACYAENVFHIGPSGHAIKLKLIHNYICFANVLSWCEGFALAAKEGLDLSRAIEIISAAGGRSGMLELYGKSTLERDFRPLMSLSNAEKDVRYYARWLEQAGLPGFVAESVLQTYSLASIMGHGDEGCTAVIKVFEELTGVEAHLSGGKPKAA